jgi:outer membrane protein OmpA-like peptidoglycan-associated protein
VIIFCTARYTSQIMQEDRAAAVTQVAQEVAVPASIQIDKIKNALAQMQEPVEPLQPEPQVSEAIEEPQLEPEPVLEPVEVKESTFTIIKDSEGALKLTGTYGSEEEAKELEALVASATPTMIGEEKPEWYRVLGEIIPLFSQKFASGAIQFNEGVFSIEGVIQDRDAMDRMLSIIDNAKIDIDNRIAYMPPKSEVDKNETLSGLTNLVNAYKEDLKKEEEREEAQESAENAKAELVRFVKETKISFPTNSYQPHPSQRKYVLKLVKLLKKNPDAKIRVIGHADSRGRKAYNQKLSVMRAQRVIQCFTSIGIDADRVEVLGYGEMKPLVPNTSKENMAKNRRVEFEIIGEEQ